MSAFPSPLRFLLLALAVALATGGAVRADSRLSAVSPFASPQASGQLPAATETMLEFRGYMQTSEGLRFRIFDPRRKQGWYLKLNERDPDCDIVVRQYLDTSTDEARPEAVLVEQGGRTMALALREGRIAPAGGPAPAPVASTPARPDNAPPGRIMGVAAEVARLRALHEQQKQRWQPQPDIVEKAVEKAKATITGMPRPLNRPVATATKQ